jgi:hypothetical protein
MEVRGQFHAPETKWVPEPLWTLWNREKSPAWNRTAGIQLVAHYCTDWAVPTPDAIGAVNLNAINTIYVHTVNGKSNPTMVCCVKHDKELNMKHGYVMVVFNGSHILLIWLYVNIMNSKKCWACCLILIISGLVINFILWCTSFFCCWAHTVPPLITSWEQRVRNDCSPYIILLKKFPSVCQ